PAARGRATRQCTLIVVEPIQARTSILHTATRLCTARVAGPVVQLSLPQRYGPSGVIFPDPLEHGDHSWQPPVELAHDFGQALPHPRPLNDLPHDRCP